jgi:propanol-preferring alcohol dehydrogenase
LTANTEVVQDMTMRAMVLDAIGPLAENPEPLRLADVPEPVAGLGELLVRVRVCGVCHTELDEIEGRTPPARLPAILGHQAVGVVEAVGEQATTFRVGDRVGVAWIFSACGECPWCVRGDENLCDAFRATGRDVAGGYAELMTVPEGFAHAIPGVLSDAEAAPMLCAGAIGYRSLRLTGLRDGQRLGLTGFGASGHLVLKLARERFPASDVYVFARSEHERVFARELGAAWFGDTHETPPALLDAIIDTTPAWTPVVAALRRLAQGGRLVINAIRKEESDKEALQGLNYPADLWREKEIKSVANVTRRDVREFLELAAARSLRPEVEEFALEDANRALGELRDGSLRGAKLLRISG